MIFEPSKMKSSPTVHCEFSSKYEKGETVPTWKLASNWSLTQNNRFFTKQNFDLTQNMRAIDRKFSIFEPQNAQKER